MARRSGVAVRACKRCLCQPFRVTAQQHGSVRSLPTGRLLAVDDDGRMMRASWHLERGFVNLSIWRDDRCVETFHLTIEDAARLTGFLVEGFAEVTASVADIGRSPEPGVVSPRAGTTAIRRWYDAVVARVHRP